MMCASIAVDAELTSAANALSVVVIGRRPRRRRLNWAAARRHRWRLLYAGIGLKHGAARARELRGILAQARRDPVDVRYLVKAQTPDIRRAGHLLLEGPAIFLRERGILAGRTANKR